jgi:hypothetical protein
VTNLVDEDFLFINVETQPPKLTNFTNIMNGADNFVSSCIHAYFENYKNRLLYLDS